MYGEEIILYRVWWGNLMERGHLKNLVLRGGMILKWISKRWDWVL